MIDAPTGEAHQVHDLDRGTLPCNCERHDHEPRLVVITGGPGAGKTALLEMARRVLCQHVAVLPEAASIVFGGGFPRLRDTAARAAAQRAIFHVQHELEEMVLARRDVGVALCDRGTLDGLAYWPGEDADYWGQVGTTREVEMARYQSVVHLDVPPAEHGYAITPMRIETAEEAAAIDDRIADAWAGHPDVQHIDSSADFLDKIDRAKRALQRVLPRCCRNGLT